MATATSTNSEKENKIARDRVVSECVASMEALLSGESRKRVLIATAMVPDNKLWTVYFLCQPLRTAKRSTSKSSSKKIKLAPEAESRQALGQAVWAAWSTFRFWDEDSEDSPEDLRDFPNITDTERHIFIAKALHLFGVECKSHASHGPIAYLRTHEAYRYHRSFAQRLTIAVKSTTANSKVNPAAQLAIKLQETDSPAAVSRSPETSLYPYFGRATLFGPNGAQIYWLEHNPGHKSKWISEGEVADRYRWEYSQMALHKGSASLQWLPANDHLFFSYLDGRFGNKARLSSRLIKQLEKDVGKGDNGAEDDEGSSSDDDGSEPSDEE